VGLCRDHCAWVIRNMVRGCCLPIQVAIV
jgi:hypothetical protein